MKHHRHKSWSLSSKFMQRRVSRLLALPPIFFFAYWFPLAVIRVGNLRFNVSGSMPLGIYRVVERTPARGAIVGVCIPTSLSSLLRERQYIGEGQCAGGLRPVMKRIGAVNGDVVTVEKGRVLVNGKGSVWIRKVDSQGRQLPQLAMGNYEVGEDEYWIFGEHRASFDSRYFGGVEEENIIAVVEPLMEIS